MPNTARGGGISRKITDAPDRKTAEGNRPRTGSARRHGRDFPHGRRGADQAGNQARLRISDAHVGDGARTDASSTAPALVYEEGSLIKRAIRDLYSREIDEVVVAGEAGYREASDFMRLLMPSHAKTVSLIATRSRSSPNGAPNCSLTRCYTTQCERCIGRLHGHQPDRGAGRHRRQSGRSTREHNIEETALQDQSRSGG